MKIIPTKFIKLIAFFIFLLVGFSCAKDSDLLTDAERRELAGEEPKNGVGSGEDGAIDEDLIARTTIFYPLNDAYVQDSEGFNKSIVRLEEGNRTSYLMYDLSAINEVEGIITSASLQISIEIDEGDGTINVYRGLSSDWSESDLNASNSPEQDLQLGSLSKIYELGSSEYIILDPEEIIAEKTSLILTHSGGNDLAFASKEHPAGNGPKLLITYRSRPEMPIIENDPPVVPGENTTPPPGEQEHAVPPTQNPINNDVAYWKDLFDEKWSDDYDDALAKANSDNKNQEYYYLGYYIEGLCAIWQATGDNEYLETALNLVNTTINDADNVGNGFQGWRSSAGDENALWDSFYWRHVTTLLRVIDNSPSVKSIYSADFNDILEFSETHIWDRYESYGTGNFYRSRTHMASHWARIGMDLYLITGKSKYREVFENISFGEMDGRPSNLREQIYNNPSNPNAYLWDKEWGVAKGSSLQDTSHAGAIVSFMVMAHEANMYWSKSDVDALVVTLDKFSWPDQHLNDIRKNIDGGGGGIPDGRINEWLHLGRYDSNLQQKIKEHYVGKHLSFYGSQSLGIAALNAKILADGSAVYPEN